jgi:hypothetical protein
MKSLPKLIGYGLLSWLIPFLASFPFVDPSGNFRIDETFFKTIMIIIGALSGTVLMVLYFKHIDKNWLKEGIKIGVTWLSINIVLDLIFVLMGFFQMSVTKYFTDIGLRYLVILIFAIGMGWILEKKLKA